MSLSSIVQARIRQHQRGAQANRPRSTEIVPKRAVLAASPWGPSAGVVGPAHDRIHDREQAA